MKISRSLGDVISFFETADNSSSLILRTCILTAEMRHVFVHAFVETFSPLEKGGIFKVALWFVTKSRMLKLLSAIIMQSSLGSNLSMRPDFIVMFV